MVSTKDRRTEYMPDGGFRDRLTTRGKVLAWAGIISVAGAVAAPAGVAIDQALTHHEVAGCDLRVPDRLPNGKGFTEWGLATLVTDGNDPVGAELNIDTVNNDPDGVGEGIVYSGLTKIEIPQEYCTVARQDFPNNVSALRLLTHPDNHQG